MPTANTEVTLTQAARLLGERQHRLIHLCEKSVVALKHPHFHVHFTPTGASWLNQVERWFGLLTERQLRRSTHRSTAELETAIREYLRVHNTNPTPFKLRIRTRL